PSLILGMCQEIAKIIARRKGARYAEQDMDANVLIAFGGKKRPGHGGVHRSGQRIFLFRAVHADHLNRSQALDEDCHGRSAARSSAAAAARLALPSVIVRRSATVWPSRFSAMNRASVACPASCDLTA